MDVGSIRDDRAVDALLSRVRRQTASVCKADIVFVVDSSGSIRDNNPNDRSYDNWELVLNFVANFVDKLDIGQDATRVGLVVYSNDADNRFYLNSYYEKQALVDEIKKQTYIGGTTNTAAGIGNMTTVQFRVNRGDRPNVPNIGIVITDGVSTVNPTMTLPNAATAIREKIQMFAIGVTNKIDEDELKGISSPPKQIGVNYWTSADFTILDTILADVRNVICQSLGPTENNQYCQRTAYGTICWCTTVNPIRSINGTRCQDINECDTNNAGCEDICYNNQGSFTCGCRAGFRLGSNSMECDDVNECRDDPNRCGFQGSCVNTWGSYYCINGVLSGGQASAAAAAALVGGEMAVAPGAAANTMSAGNIGTIAAIAIGAVNLVIVVALAIKFTRSRRSHVNEEQSDDVAGHVNGAFRAENGASQSFASLNSKFSPSSADADTISTSSSISAS